MRKSLIIAPLIVFCLSISALFAQSNRTPSLPDKNKKANQRPVATPTPIVEVVEDAAAPDDAPLAADQLIDDGDVIKIDTEIVTIPVRVLDRKGRFIAGLQKENFKVFEDKAEQEIAFFTNEQQPFTVALMLDMSYSTKFKLDEIQKAAISFIDQLRKDDKVMVVAFDQDVQVLTEPTSDRQRIYNAIKQTKIAYGTSLYQAIDFVINQRFKKIQGRKAIVLFTDGVDTTSPRGQDLTNLRDLEEFDALVYPIRYDTYADVQALKNQPIGVPTAPLPGGKNPLPFPLPPGGIGTADGAGTSAEDYRRAEQYLNDLANGTNGEIYEADSLTNLDRAFSGIAAQLREFYSIGYYPPEGVAEGKKRRIKVQVDQKNVAVRARESYTVGKKEKDKK